MADILALVDLADRLHDDESRAEVAYRLCSITLRTGDYAAANERLDGRSPGANRPERTNW